MKNKLYSFYIKYIYIILKPFYYFRVGGANLFPQVKKLIIF